MNIKKEPILVNFKPSSLGRVDFFAHVSTADCKSFRKIDFKLDSGSDFTTLSVEALELLGYNEKFLKSCPFHKNKASVASGIANLKLQYINNVSIKFGDRELQGCRIFFALNTALRNLFGADLLKYFNREINYDDGLFVLQEVRNNPALAENENRVHIYSVEM